ncbi:hypothetical protein NE865_04223 [Phthorimaea operculella]|nr:hypothetical protein NE865_04223 [Phthorimaea operculella]
MILDDCDKALSLAGAADFGIKYACANFSRKVLPPRCDIPTETCHRFLDLTGPLQIGGLPNIPSSFQVKNKDFVGCISDFHIDHKFIDLNTYVADNGTIAGCPEKRSQCGSAPCYNGAECKDLWDTYLCECGEGYTGKDCAESTSPPWRFSGDGMLSFNPLLRPIQLPWLNALSIRTRQQDAFLMSIQVGQNSTIFISLKSGLLHYSYNGESMFLPAPSLSDGIWHRVEIKWLGTDIQVTIDYGLRTALLPMLANKVQGQYIGKILIGGPDSTAGLLASEVGYFEGCIQDVRVGTAQSLLNRPTVRENVRDGCQSRADCMLSICPPYSKCVSSWDNTECQCERGRYGPQCIAACDLKPCGDHATCIPEDSDRGYHCQCDEGYLLTSDGCIQEGVEECPGGWWGVKACGPCACDVTNGYHPHCERNTGHCHCKENHYKLPGSDECLPCQCYAAGSVNSSCEASSGQCYCRGGVIGRACDACANLYAEVAPSIGCEGIVAVSYELRSYQCYAAGQCYCRGGVIGRACDACANLYAEVAPSIGCEVLRGGAVLRRGGVIGRACDACANLYAEVAPSIGCEGIVAVSYELRSYQCYAAGQCYCRGGVIGRACDACANLYAEVAPSIGCEGIVAVSYELRSYQCYAAGQCYCRGGVIGRACDACANLYAEVAPSIGCEGIVAVSYELRSYQCYAAGQCYCRGGVIGRACDACANLYAEVAPSIGCEGIVAVGYELRSYQCYAAGQCYCRGGVIGRACDACANLYAEVAPSIGCEVVYDGCPRSFSHGVWWPRTKFGVEAVTDCPAGTSGRGTRMCDESQLVPWQEPDMFNCTTSTFYQLRKQLTKIETGELTMNTFVGVRLAEDLAAACANTPKLYGADMLVSEGILLELLQYELKQAGLNLTHSQDKDYVKNIIKSANTILDIQYSREWRRIRTLTGRGIELLLQKLDKYIAVLAESQHDTYTNPFEIVTSDMVIGVDIVTSESIYGFEPTQLTQLNRANSESYTTERVVLPDTSSFIHSPIQPGYYGNGKSKSKKPSSPTVSFPKYNNYVKNKNKFDKFTRVLLPLDLIGIANNNLQENMDSNFESRAVFSYLQYSRNTSSLMPLRYDESVSTRWGVNITVGSTILQVALFVPEHVWIKESAENSLETNVEESEGITYTNKGEHQNTRSNNIPQTNNHQHWPNDMDHHENHGPVVIQPTYKKQEKPYNNMQENDSAYTAEKLESPEGPKVMALVMEQGNVTMKKKLVYKSLGGIRLKKPIRLQLWLDIDRETFGSRTNPQCVHWSTLRGFGEWSRVGCHTEIDYDWSPYSDQPLLINCTCNHLSTFAVLVDEVDIEVSWSEIHYDWSPYSDEPLLINCTCNHLSTFAVLVDEVDIEVSWSEIHYDWSPYSDEPLLINCTCNHLSTFAVLVDEVDIEVSWSEIINCTCNHLSTFAVLVDEVDIEVSWSEIINCTCNHLSTFAVLVDEVDIEVSWSEIINCTCNHLSTFAVLVDEVDIEVSWSEIINCTCNHLSTFAVLVDEVDIEVSWSEIHYDWSPYSDQPLLINCTCNHLSTFAVLVDEVDIEVSWSEIHYDWSPYSDQPLLINCTCNHLSTFAVLVDEVDIEVSWSEIINCTCNHLSTFAVLVDEVDIEVSWSEIINCTCNHLSTFAVLVDEVDIEVSWSEIINCTCNHLSTFAVLVDEVDIEVSWSEIINCTCNHLSTFAVLVDEVDIEVSWSEIINCTCNHLSTFAVLVDEVDIEVSWSEIINCTCNHLSTFAVLVDEVDIEVSWSEIINCTCNHLSTFAVLVDEVDIEVSWSEIHYDWSPYSAEPLLINCTCNHLSTFAVLVDEVDIEVSWSEIHYDWSPYSDQPLLINCTCNHLSTFAVLVDEVDIEVSWSEIHYDWSPYSDQPLLINCTCNHLSTFAVLVDEVDIEVSWSEIHYDWSPYSDKPLLIVHLSTFAVLVDEVDIEFIPEPSLLESVTSYTAFSLSLPLLFATWAALCLMRGGAATVSNSIHKHLIFCVFMAELLYLIALKARTSLVRNEFACKLIAMSLHYWWVSSLAWCACDAWQLRRLVRELRDVNHGGLAAHLAAAYAAPAVILALAASHHQHQYGNALFCWVSCHEPVVWWVVVPAAVYAGAALLFLAGATRAAFTVRDHVTGFGNLRMLLAVSIICLPLLCVAWASGLILGSEAGDRRNVLSSVLAGAVALHAAAACLGYIAFNIRVRDNLRR